MSGLLNAAIFPQIGSVPGPTLLVSTKKNTAIKFQKLVPVQKLALVTAQTKMSRVSFHKKTTQETVFLKSGVTAMREMDMPQHSSVEETNKVFTL